MSEKDKKLLLRLLIVAVVIVLGACIFNMTKKQTSVGEMQWLMVPSGDVYFVRDGNEPADNYSDIWYDEWAKLYYIDWEKGGRTYVTPEGKPVEMTGEYEYLKNLPIPASGIGENGEYYDYYIYADGTEAFSQRFRYAHPFEGDYAIVQNGDEKNGVINKEGMPVYSAEFVREDLNYLDGSLFAEQRRNDCKIVDISTGKTLRILKDTEFYNRFNEGYIFVDRKKECCYLTDKEFKPIWSGKNFDMIFPITEYKDKELRFLAYLGDSRAILDEKGNELLKLKSAEEQRVFTGDGRILVYDKGRINCYDYEGKEVFTKKYTTDFDPTDVMHGGFQCDVSAITLDGETYGVVNKDGKMLTRFSYNDAEAYSNGTVLVAFDRKAGILGLQEKQADL